MYLRAANILMSLIWKEIMQNTTICFFTLLSPSCLFHTFSLTKRKNNRQGSSCNLWNELAYLPEATRTTERLCLLSLCEAESQHANVYPKSSPLSFNPTAVLCLFAVSGAFMVTTHTAGQRGEPTSVSGGKDEWDSHNSGKRKRLINFSANIHIQEGEYILTQSTVSLITLLLLQHKVYNENS